MAAGKPEVQVYQLLDKIKTKFQKIPHVVGVQQNKRNYLEHYTTKAEVAVQHGGIQTGSSYISALG